MHSKKFTSPSLILVPTFSPFKRPDLNQNFNKLLRNVLNKLTVTAVSM